MQSTGPSVDARATASADQALVARAATLLQSNGESTSTTLVAVERLSRGLDGQFAVVPGWSSTTVLDGQRDPLVTVASPVGVGMRTVTIVMGAIDRFARRSISRSELAAQLDRAAAARPMSLWLFIAACATGASALSIIFGAQDATAVGLVAFSAAFGGLVRRLLGRMRVGPLGQVFAAAVIAGTVGGLAVGADLSSSLRLIAVCPAMILVPGPHILNGFLDLFALRIPLGFARLGYAAALLLAIGLGLAITLAAFGTDLPVEPVGRTVPLWLDVVAAGVAAASYPVYFAMPLRLIIWPVVVGAVAHGLRTWAMDDLGWNIAAGATIACLVTGIVLAPVTSRLQVPYAGVAFAAVVSLVPGVYVFRMIDALGRLPFGGSNADLLGAITDGTTATAIVIGMAVGLAAPQHIYGQFRSAREKRP
jgi:uncharacterized membrane protein YjjB (DUF3815 family)